MLYPVALSLLRALPEHEYVQTERAPAWFAVAIGAGLTVLSLLALTALPHEGDQVFIGFSATSPLLMVDAYTLWGSALLGVMLAVASWVPAARRSLVPHSTWPFSIILLLTWASLLMLFGVQLRVILLGWLAVLGGIIGLWWYLFRPQRNWFHFEIALVLLLSAILGGSGLLWMLRLTHGEILINLWSTLLSASPRATNGVVLLLAIGWLGPAAYLPWWLWMRREEESMVFLPAALLLATVGHLTLVHVLFLSFPAASAAFRQATGVEYLFLVRQVLGWLLAWGLLALLMGAGWLAYITIQQHKVRISSLRPLTLVATGMLILGVAGGLLAQGAQGIIGLCWMQLTWVGVIGIWLSAGGLLPVLASAERPERRTVQVALWVALVTLAALPPLAGFHGLAALWSALNQAAIPPALIVFTLVVTGLCTALLLPRWVAAQQAETPRAGVGWGILAPFLLALVLVACGLLSRQLTPGFELIKQSLLQMQK